MITKIFVGLFTYLKNWKNLAIHSLIGIALLLFALKAPIPAWIRILVLVLVVIFNVTRTRLEKKHKEKTVTDQQS